MTNVFGYNGLGNTMINFNTNVLSVVDLTVTNSVNLPVNSLAISNTSNLQTELNSKQNTIISTTDIDCNDIICSSLIVDTNTLIVDSINKRVGINKTPTVALDILGECIISSNLTVDSNLLYVEASTNKIGIGNDDPQAKLDVTGDVIVSGNLTVNNVNVITELNSKQNTIISTTDMWKENGFAQPTGLITCNELKVNTDALFVNSINKNVGLGTILPESCLHVVGTRNNATPGYGVHIGNSGSATGNFGIEISSNITGDSVIDFTEPGQNVRGRILYDNNAEEFKIRTNDNGSYGMILDSAHNLLIEGNISGNLNSTRGQLISFIGEENSSLNLNNFDFNYGNGSISNPEFGMMLPCSVKLKKFCYAGNKSGTDPTSTSITVFQLFSNGTAQSVFAFCDYSNTTNGSITYHRFSNKFSSSATSQINVEHVITDSGFGINLSWKTITLRNKSTDNGHRFSIVCETQDDL